MTVRSIYRWQHPDSTADMTLRLDRLVEKGLIWGGACTPGAGLHVLLDPFVAVSQEGMTVISDAVETLVVAANQVNVVVLYSKRNPFGIPAAPIEQIQVFSWAVYNVHPDKNLMIVLAEVDLALGAVVVNPGDISFLNRDEVTPVGRSQFRGTCLFAALPVPASLTNRIGDFYWVSDQVVFYFWDGAAWAPINTGSYNLETTALNNEIIRAQERRNQEGSGVLSGPRPGGASAAPTELRIVDTPAVANSFDLDAFSAVINGHYIETHARAVAMPAKPVVGTRYDLVFLEVYRIDIANPEGALYDRGPAGALQYTVNEVDQQEEGVLFTRGTAGNNYNVNELGLQSHVFKNLVYRFGVASGVPATALYNPTDPATAALGSNVDAVAFAPGVGSDTRIWTAVSATPIDGVSWALPLLVVKRTSAEDFTVNNAIQTFRSGVRWIFPVHGVCDIGHDARELLDTVHRLEPAMADDPASKTSFEKQSGFITGLDYDITNGVAANSLTFFDAGAKIRIKGFEDYLTFASNEIDLGAPPVALWERVVVYIEMTITLYTDDEVTKPYYRISPTHRPYVPSVAGGLVQGQGWKRGYVTYQVVVSNIGAFDAIDEDEAMSQAGWSKGDPSAPEAFSDGGIWHQHIAIDSDDRIHPYQLKWAIPVALVHRRNTAAYHYNTNPNGTGVTRPDDRTVATVISPKDLISLRHMVDIGEADLALMVDQNLDLLMKGQLRTKFSNKLQGSGAAGVVGGSQILQTDVIGVGGAPGAYELQSGDSMRRIWSDAREYHVVSVSFDPYAGAPISNDLMDYTYVGGVTKKGTLVIKAPPGAHLLRHIPAVAYCVGDSADPDYLDFYGSPLWSTRTHLSSALATHAPSPVKAFYYDSADDTHHQLEFYRYGLGLPAATGNAIPGEPFLVTTRDLLGRATEMTGAFYVDPAADAPFAAVPATALVRLSWWVHYDRSFVATGDFYHLNYGLAEIPDEVHKVTRDPLGVPEQVNVGALYVVLQQTGLVAVTDINFTAADVAAATGLPGAVTLVGLDYGGISFSPDPAGVLSVLMNDTQTTITLHLTMAFTGKVSVPICFYTADVSHWVEVGRGGKSVQALFSWSNSAELDTGGAPPTDYVRTLSASVIWTVPEICGKRSTSFPQVWGRIAPGAGNWTLQAVTEYGFEYSNMICLNPSVDTMLRYIKVIAPSQTPLTGAATDHLLIEYTYTPYQGKSNRAGETPSVVTALPALKNLLHGTIEANSDFYAIQSGAASFFSGVLSWSGFPINARNTKSAELSNPMSLSRFEEYNFTELVRPTYDRGGAYGLDPNSNGIKYLNAAAILRLPFPEHTLMAQTNYHAGIMSFDIDPARAGVGAGTLNYAPGYWGDPLNDYAKVRYDQFSNGLTPLGRREESFNLVITPDQFVLGSDSVVAAEGPDLYYGVADRTLTWLINNKNTARMELFGSIKNPMHTLVKRALTALYLELELNPLIDTTGSGLHLYSSEDGAFKAIQDNAWWTTPTVAMASYLLLTSHYSAIWTSIKGFAGPMALQILASLPGEILYFYQTNGAPLASMLRLYSEPTAGQDVQVFGTTALIDTIADSGQQRGMSGTSPMGAWRTWVLTDVLRLPLSSNHRTMAYRMGPSIAAVRPIQQISNANGATSLRGREIAYPDSWAAGDITSIETLISPTLDIRGAGRGLYCGDTSRRCTMPVLVPGSGMGLDQILTYFAVQLGTATTAPDSFPYMPGEQIFQNSNRVCCRYDHGGPVAYVCMGLLINPSSTAYRNNLVLQVAGGPTGRSIAGTSGSVANNAYSSEELDGTALDAFWPKNRPLLSKRH